MNKEEQFFATCSFCKKPNQLIVFDLAWKGQRGKPSNQYVKGGRIWLCSPCCRSYHQEWDSVDYDKEADKMCEVLG